MITYGFHAHDVVFRIILNVLEVCFLHDNFIMSKSYFDIMKLSDI